MKKIMFNDHFGLTEAVINGTKTVTRRLLKECDYPINSYFGKTYLEKAGYVYGVKGGKDIKVYPPFEVGEIVAVAQSYYQIANQQPDVDYFLWQVGMAHKVEVEEVSNLPAWTNKKFVIAKLMPRQIRILDMRAEKLQDITEDDCFREGIMPKEIKINGNSSVFSKSTYRRKGMSAGVIYNKQSARETFAILIDKISGKETWAQNSFVWRIEFELVK